MKKIMFSGLDASVTEEAVRAQLEQLGPVRSVTIARDGDASSPLVIVEIDISDDLAYRITSRVSDYWHNGQMINARLLLH